MRGGREGAGEALCAGVACGKPHVSVEAVPLWMGILSLALCGCVCVYVKWSDLLAIPTTHILNDVNTTRRGWLVISMNLVKRRHMLG